MLELPHVCHRITLLDNSSKKYACRIKSCVQEHIIKILKRMGFSPKQFALCKYEFFQPRLGDTDWALYIDNVLYSWLIHCIFMCPSEENYSQVDFNPQAINRHYYAITYYIDEVFRWVGLCDWIKNGSLCMQAVRGIWQSQVTNGSLLKYTESCHVNRCLSRWR